MHKTANDCKQPLTNVYSSATDIVRAINDEDDYVKAGNYWRWLKKKLNTDGLQLVSVTHDFKFQSPDGKQRAANVYHGDATKNKYIIVTMIHDLFCILQNNCQGPVPWCASLDVVNVSTIVHRC